MEPRRRRADRRPARVRLILILLTGSALGLAGGCEDRGAPEMAPAELAHFDFEPFLFAPDDHSVKDHTVVVHGASGDGPGTIHLFYTTGTDSLGRWQPPGNEIHFGHATSPDWRHWTVHAPVVDWSPQPWEERNRWAPHVVRDRDGGYRMYYTGVNRHIAQSIGMATSRDLVDWRPAGAAPVFQPDTTWARWRPDGWSNCRDPFVLRHDGSWWMVVTATARDGREALGLAHSADGRRWEDRGPLLIGERGEPLESPQLVRLDGRWLLLFTSGLSGGTWLLESTDLEGPWRFDARRRWLEGIAPEVTQAGDATWITRHATFDGGSRRRFVLLIDRLRLDATGPALDPPLLPGWTAPTGAAFLGQPILGDNPRWRGEAGVEPGGVGWIGTAEGFARPPDPPGAWRGDAPTGRLRSRPFTLRGEAISLRIGGTRRPGRIAVALRRAGDDRPLFQETGHGGEALETRVWWTAPLRGSTVTLELLDDDPAGHLNVDDIREWEHLPHGLRSIEINGPADAAAGTAAGDPSHAATRTATMTTCRVVAELMAFPPPGELRADVVDATGASVCELALSIEPAGAGLRALGARWNGTDATGRRLPPGDYRLRLPLAGSAELVLRLEQALQQ